MSDAPTDPPATAAARAPEVLLHVGLMKTGTSYVQGLLERDRGLFAAEGVLVPADVGRAVHEVLDLRGARALGDLDGAWDRLVAEIRGWTGDRVIVSMEFLALATPRQVETIVSALAPSRVRVVVTVRDLGRAVPSAWQQAAKTRQRVTWDEFVAAVTADDPGSTPVGTQFWRHHDAAGIAARWAAAVGPGSVTVVTVPPAGAPPRLLWRRFCTATGLDPAAHAPDGSERRNPSLGHAEAEALRRLNIALGNALDQPTYRRLVNGLVARRLVRRGGKVSPPVRLPVSAGPWAAARASTTIDELRALGARVVGDLEDLRPATPCDDAADRSGSDVGISAHAVAEVCVRVAAGLVEEIAAARASGAAARRGG